MTKVQIIKILFIGGYNLSAEIKTVIATVSSVLGQLRAKLVLRTGLR